MDGAVVVRAMYFVGAVCIVLVTLALGWVVVWKLMLSKMKLVRELLDLNPPTSPPPASKPASFDERLKQYKENPKRRQTGSSLLVREDDSTN
ncbi:hypothetical protein SPRG_11822 [Saprolegnia parasitica CBS 223.65]|uniref:Uncharacterized protein n=1 Tax=Saprolegnia parasitica (strain CBS 223.65) TaxID=695850 RepID=A0A067C1H5_SAPPC|nr:hypothetical protein SPRG_11822 [Saprolegnia parasitica CBS 223.65]KDO22975.1 hypothetical protein SPRG_11822 [Saprolegnia parasitica CBS 223.65]|eukprot:XP_012206266.1 hypothetical protein SPRG_11822 [Saprolegnia parasitica CBS 223.65]